MSEILGLGCPTTAMGDDNLFVKEIEYADGALRPWSLEVTLIWYFDLIFAFLIYFYYFFSGHCYHTSHKMSCTLKKCMKMQF